MVVEPLQEVVGLLGVAVALPRLGGGVRGATLLDEPAVAHAYRVQDGGIEGVAAFRLCFLDCLLHFDQQADHLVCPPLVPHDGDGFELAEVMGIAQGVDDVLGAVGPPAVVAGDARHLGHHPHVVDGHLATSAVDHEKV